MKIVPIMTAKETFSPGDAMRDIYTRGLVTSDFVLVMGDLVSNIKIDEVVRVHKERRKTNKDAIMTIVVKESGVRHRTRFVCSFLVSFFFFGYVVINYHVLELEVNPLCLCSIRRRQNVCITSTYKVFRERQQSPSLARSWLHILK